MNCEKTISATTHGIIVSYSDAKKHMFVGYERPKYVKKIQLEGTAKYQNIDNFTPSQRELFMSTVYGFSAFTKNEIEAMSKTKKFKIKVAYTKANRILNRWKQEIINEGIDSLLISLFSNSPVIKKFTAVKGYDDNIICSISFKELGINKKQIANKLIEYGILPVNFYQLV
jgi:hypothetical protein